MQVMQIEKARELSARIIPHLKLTDKERLSYLLEISYGEYGFVMGDILEKLYPLTTTPQDQLRAFRKGFNDKAKELGINISLATDNRKNFETSKRFIWFKENKMGTHLTNAHHAIEKENEALKKEIAELRKQINEPKPIFGWCVRESKNYQGEEVVFYGNGKAFCRAFDDDDWQEKPLPHQQDDLKHLFEGDK